MGGMVAAIESGFARQLIDQAAFAWSDQIDRKERLVVGVNAHTDLEPPRGIYSKSARKSASVRSTG